MVTRRDLSQPPLLANLMLVTRAAMAMLNHPARNYPPEVAALIQLKGAIKRQVNRMEREAAPAG